MIKILSQNELRRLDSALSHIPYKDAAVISLLLFSGLRVGEVCRLMVSDLVKQDGTISEVRIRASISKTGVGRWVPIPVTARRYLVMYISSDFNLPDSATPAIYLFPGSAGRDFMSVHGIEQMVSRVTLRYLGRVVMPHALRHTYATQLLKFSNTREVQMLLGHKKLSSTEVYTHPSSVDLAKSVNRAFP